MTGCGLWAPCADRLPPQSHLNTGKAIIADKIFNTNGQFALDYLEAEIALTKPPEKPVAQSEAKDDDEEGEGEEVAEVEGDADGGD